MENKGANINAPSTSFQQRTLVISAIIVLLVILLVGGFGLFAFAHAGSPPKKMTAMPKPTYNGLAAFVSSGQVNNISLDGVCDGIEVSINNMTPPAAGHKYYVWLLADKKNIEGSTVMLGTLNVQQGHGYLKYQDPQYHNLLAQYSQLLVTEEDGQMMPVNPSPDASTWRYSGILPQTPNTTDSEHLSALDHLRHLLVDSPEQMQINLQGGLAYWFDQNTHKLLEWASATHGTMLPNDAPAMRRQFKRILGYLDGTVPGYAGMTMGGSSNSGSNMGGSNNNNNGNNMGGNNGGMNGGKNTNKKGMSATVNFQGISIPKDDYTHTGMIPLLGKNGYIAVMSMHIDGLRKSPNITDKQIQIINLVFPSLDFVNNQLGQVRQDIVKLQRMNDKDLLGSIGLPVLNDMITHVNNAYLGTTDLVTGQHFDGAYNLHQDIAQLALVPLQTVQH